MLELCQGGNREVGRGNRFLEYGDQGEYGRDSSDGWHFVAGSFVRVERMYDMCFDTVAEIVEVAVPLYRY